MCWILHKTRIHHARQIQWPRLGSSGWFIVLVTPWIKTKRKAHIHRPCQSCSNSHRIAFLKIGCICSLETRYAVVGLIHPSSSPIPFDSLTLTPAYAETWLFPLIEWNWLFWTAIHLGGSRCVVNQAGDATLLKAFSLTWVISALVSTLRFSLYLLDIYNESLPSTECAGATDWWE